jgi:dTDP-4-amino-4,6-dideoxygalactose transaminase
MLRNPQKIVEWFEEEVAHYTGAKYAIAVDNCTNAIRLCCECMQVKEVTIPARTYISVPQSIMQAGGSVKFLDYDWKGVYQLYPYPIYDAAKRFTSNMYVEGTLMCLSFGIKKLLKLGKGGMILLDDKLDCYQYLKRKRWSGRTEGIPMEQDNPQQLGYNCYMTPEVAARGLMLMSVMPKHNKDQVEEPDYPDLRNYGIFGA